MVVLKAPTGTTTSTAHAVAVVPAQTSLTMPTEATGMVTDDGSDTSATVVPGGTPRAVAVLTMVPAVISAAVTA